MGKANSKSSRPSIERLKVILSRQGIDKYGADYQPAIMATRAEAPSISNAATILVPMLGRRIHVLSVTELDAALLALYHNCLFELLEQKMLSTGPCPHPLSAHPYARGMDLAKLRGTVAIAEEMGVLSLHPTVRWHADELGNKSVLIPYPYIGDLLLFLMDHQGPYVVNWNCKLKRGDFMNPEFKILTSTCPEKTKKKARIRTMIESEYYSDAGIRTVYVAGEDIDLDVSINLRMLVPWLCVRHDISSKQVRSLEDRYLEAMVLGVPPIEVLREQVIKGISDHVCKAILYQAIWHRKIRVDLYKPILIDRPLRPETKDVLHAYRSWFER